MFTIEAILVAIGVITALNIVLLIFTSNKVNKALTDLAHTKADINLRLTDLADRVYETPEEKELTDIIKDLYSESENDDSKPTESAEEDELDIHLITPQQFYFENIPGYENYHLRYYCENDDLVYVCLDGTVSIANVTECVGDALNFFGMNPNDPDHVYVRNNVFKANFLIERTYSNFNPIA